MEARIEIEELISKFLSGEASPEEAMFLEDWKAESASNLELFERSEKAFALVTKQPFQQEVSVEKAWEKVQPKIGQAKKSNSISLILKIAAAMILIFGATKIFFNSPTTEKEIVYQASTSAKQVRLIDGTDISISPNSTITECDNYGKKERKIKLKGRANFTVKHSEEIPFIIDAGGVFIQDIGTKFTVENSSDSVFVDVQEGIVELYDLSSTKVILHANEKAIYSKSKRKIISMPKSMVSLQFEFVESTLKEVVQQLSQSYNVPIVLNNKALENCDITTHFNNEKLDVVLTIITETLGLHYEKVNGKYIISGVQCIK